MYTPSRTIASFNSAALAFECRPTWAVAVAQWAKDHSVVINHNMLPKVAGAMVRFENEVGNYRDGAFAGVRTPVLEVFLESGRTLLLKGSAANVADMHAGNYFGEKLLVDSRPLWDALQRAAGVAFIENEGALRRAAKQHGYVVVAETRHVAAVYADGDDASYFEDTVGVWKP